MRFFKYYDNDETGFELSPLEEELIEAKAVELKKLCYEFKCCNFEAIRERMWYDEEIKGGFTAKQVADKLGAILPFVKENKKNLFELNLFGVFLRKIEEKTCNIIVSVLGYSISKNDIKIDLIRHKRYDFEEIIDAFVEFCDKEMVYKIYDYLNRQEHDNDEY